MNKIYETLETLCRGGVSFEDALEQVGLNDSPLQITMMLFKYWKVLEMEHAHNAAKVYYDKLLKERV